jgi:hypothetical protein
MKALFTGASNLHGISRVQTAIRKNELINPESIY